MSLPVSSAASQQYDSFSEIYSVWTGTAASARANLSFYLDAYAAAAGPVVELGVGDGRIAVAAATRGCSLVGIDASRAMLARCRQNALAAGVGDRLRLVEADFRTFTLDEPAALITLPYHSLGHLTAIAEKQAALRHILSQLRPGGQFIFDDFLVTAAVIAHMRQVQLRAAYRSPGGADMLLWVTSLVDEPSQSMTVVTWEDELDGDGVLAARRYRRLSLSWLSPAQARQLLESAGFIVDACYGDFDRTPFSDAAAREQVWVARRPELDS